MAKQRFKTDPTTMTPREFEQFLVRRLAPCDRQVCYEDALVLVSYPTFDGRLRWCVCTRCGTHHVKPELPRPAEPRPIPSMPGSALGENEDAVWFRSTTPTEVMLND